MHAFAVCLGNGSVGFFFSGSSVVTIVLSCNLRSDSVLPEAALFLLWVALAVWGPLCFHVD